MPSRVEEAEIVDRCVAVALLGAAGALSQREANVLRLAAMILRPRFPAESERLLAECDRYFLSHPADLVESAQIVRNGWVASPSRFRDMLELRLNCRLGRLRASRMVE